MLTVSKLLALVCPAQDLTGIFAFFASVVYFKLYAEIAAAAAIENRVGFVAVFVDIAITLHLVEAAPTIGVLLACIVLFIVGGAGGYMTAAACTGSIEGFLARLTQGDSIPYIFICPYALPTVFTQHCGAFKARWAQQSSIEACKLALWKGVVADGTHGNFVHDITSIK